MEGGTEANGTLAMLMGLQSQGADPGPQPVNTQLWNPNNKDYQKSLAEWQAKKQAFDAQAGAAKDPRFGDLTKKFTLADFWDDPVTKASYQTGLKQGTEALERMAGARGNRNSGAQLKALTRFGTDYTGGQAAGSQARFVGDQTNIYNRLAGLSGTGQTAAQGLGYAGQNTANTISGLMGAQGNARGAAAISQGNIWSGAARNVGNTLGNYFGMNNSNYNSAGNFTPYYTGYDLSGGPAYG